MICIICINNNNNIIIINNTKEGLCRYHMICIIACVCIIIGKYLNVYSVCMYMYIHTYIYVCIHMYPPSHFPRVNMLLPCGVRNGKMQKKARIFTFICSLCVWVGVGFG